MLWVGWVVIFPDSIHCTSELAHICENKNTHCNPKWARKQEIPEEGRRQHWFSRNFLLYTMGQARHSSPRQCARWLASGSPMGPLSSCRDSWIRPLPMPDLLWVTWQSQQPPHLMLLQVVDPCHYILKKSFLACLSRYQLLKIKGRKAHELSKLAIPNYMQLSTNPAKQELSGKSVKCDYYTVTFLYSKLMATDHQKTLRETSGN